MELKCSNDRNKGREMCSRFLHLSVGYDDRVIEHSPSIVLSTHSYGPLFQLRVRLSNY